MSPFTFTRLHTPDAVRQTQNAAGIACPVTADEWARHAPNVHVVCEQNGIIASHCSLWWDDAIPDLPSGERPGVIGHYAVRDDQAARALLSHACEELAVHKCQVAIGPMDGNTWRRYRLVTGGDPAEPPFFLEPTNPDDWPTHFARSGFDVFANYHSTLTTALEAADPRADEVAARLRVQQITLRTVDGKRIDDDLRAIYRLSLLSFRRNFLYTPIEEAEFLEQYRRVLPHVLPQLTFLAHTLDGELVGFLFALPDLLQAGRQTRIDTVIVKTLAVLPGRAWAGLGRLLLDRCQRTARNEGYRRVIHALMHDANASRNLSRGVWAAQPLRQYALYARNL